jgi:ABC-type glycerol-3-phosphate transport system substrate-binding protein
MVTLLRKDWLDHLGLEVPTTFDDYVDALRAMTADNPGGGASGYYGFAGPMEFRSLKPFLTYYESIPDQWVKLDDGKVGYGAVQPETRDALEFISGLYKEGVIDPDILTRDLNFDEKYVSGTFGSCYRWISYFNPSGNAAIAFTENNPDGEYIPFWMPPNGKGTESEHYYPPKDWCAFSVTSKAKDPEKIYAFFDALTAGDDYLIKRYGFEGVHYTYEDGFMENLLLQEDNLANNVGRGLFDCFVNRKDEMNISNIPSVNDMFMKASTEGVAADRDRIAYIKTADRPVWNESRAELERLRDEYLWGILAGQRPRSEFDAFVELFNAQGGEASAKETEELYAQQAIDYENFLENFKAK